MVHNAPTHFKVLSSPGSSFTALIKKFIVDSVLIIISTDIFGDTDDIVDLDDDDIELDAAHVRFGSFTGSGTFGIIRATDPWYVIGCRRAGDFIVC